MSDIQLKNTPDKWAGNTMKPKSKRNCRQQTQTDPWGIQIMELSDTDFKILCILCSKIKKDRVEKKDRTVKSQMKSWNWIIWKN